ncbi:MAG TPA: IclR family transcriptional regulator [Metalysinibacillus sp.]
MQETVKNKTVMRSMLLLDLFEQHAELTFQEVITLSEMPKSSVYRMLQSLEELGFLEKGEDLKYRLGTIFLKYGHLVASRLDIRHISYPIMEKLHEETKEVINLTVRSGDEAIYIEKIDRYQTIRLYTEIGKKSPLYAGACPRALLAFLPVNEQTTYLERTPLVQMASGTLTTIAALKQVMAKEREQGFTVSHSELEDNTAAVAAPIYNYQGEVIAGISAAGIAANYDAAYITNLSEKTIEAAAKISAKLGYRP